MRNRAQLEAAVIARYRHMARKWGISEADAEKKAREYIPLNSDKDLRDFLYRPLKGLSINALDPAHAAADRELAKMARELNSMYSRAGKEMQEKLDIYLAQFAEADARMKQNLADGKITEEWYKQWRQDQLIQSEQWEHLRDELAQDASNSNDIAKSVIQGHMPDVYAENYNYGTYQVENAANVSTSFTLYDRQTVERLMRDNPKLLPDPAKGSKTALAIAKNKDLKWNRQHIQGELLQGILQGESIDKIAKRMRNVEKMNRAASMRYARTMTTGAENAGRIDSYKRAGDMGINMEPAWMATLDARTRDSHRKLDGETRDPKTGKFSNGCRFPGDPEGQPAEVYNCRCTLFAQLKGFEKDFSNMSWRNTDKMKGRSYEEWKKQKKVEQFRKEKSNREERYISDRRFNELTIEARKNGANIIRGTKEVEEHLRRNEATASTIGDTLLFRKDVTISDTLEETHHFMQNKNGMNDDKPSQLRSILNEIEAKEYLIDNAEKYGIPREEIALTKKHLKSYQKELEKYYEKHKRNA